MDKPLSTPRPIVQTPDPRQTSIFLPDMYLWFGSISAMYVPFMSRFLHACLSLVYTDQGPASCKQP